MSGWHPRRVRTQLTFWYLAVLAAVLLAYAGTTSALVVMHLYQQLDRAAIQDLETVEGLFFFGPEDQLHLKEDYHDNPQSEAASDRLLEVYALDGSLLYRNTRLGKRSIGGVPFPGEGVGGYSERSARLSDGTRVRVVSRVHRIGNRPSLIRLAYAEAPLWTQVAQLLSALLLGMPVALGLAGWGGYVLTRRVLGPLEQMAHRARQITAERLNERLPVENPENELGQLACAFNQTLAGLEDSFGQLRRFTADVSHELRTPLGALCNVGEIGLRGDGDSRYWRDVVGSMLEEANRLTQLVSSMLELARAEAGQTELRQEYLRIGDLIMETTELLEVLMEEKQQRLTVSGNQEIHVRGDRLFLRQTFINLLHNAVQYSPVGGHISVHVQGPTGERLTVEVTDSGPGIPLEHQTHVFDRFYRVDAARASNTGGVGLGLAFARWAARVHGGDLTLFSEPEKGCSFRLTLPTAVLPTSPAVPAVQG